MWVQRDNQSDASLWVSDCLPILRICWENKHLNIIQNWNLIRLANGFQKILVPMRYENKGKILRSILSPES